VASLSTTTSRSRFLVGLQIQAARGAVRRGMTVEQAADYATALAESFAQALNDGTLIDMGWMNEEVDPKPQRIRKAPKTNDEQLRLETS
jgi:hypothetical protein